jgi:tetratricopeptide (TPR) repeat protein
MTMHLRKRLTILAPLAALVVTGCATPTSSFEEGVHFYRTSQYLFAADEFEEAVREYPRSAAAWTNLGVTRVRLGYVDRALEAYNTAIALAPRDPEIYFDRANALLALGHHGLAIDDYTRAIELQPTYVQAWFNRGSVRAMTGQSEPALRDWLQAIDLAPDSWMQAAMRRSAGLEPATVTVQRVPQGVPTLEGTTAPPPAPGTATAAPPLPPPSTVAATPPASPSASLPGTATEIDVRTLVSRAMLRELDGDRAGALEDLRTALSLETDPARRERVERLLRALERPR